MGDSPCADEVVLARIEQDLTGPANSNKIRVVDIFWSDGTGNVKGGAVNIWTRRRLHLLHAAGHDVVSVPYQLTALRLSADRPLQHPAGGRLRGRPHDDRHHRRDDHLPVRLDHAAARADRHVGYGVTIVQTNVMRMEPVK